MTHLGIADNNFYRLMVRARDAGYTAVKHGEHLSIPFTTSRGIKQGCPLSPILFALLLSGMESYLLEQCPDAGFTIAGQRKLLVSYADDIKLLCKTELELSTCFSHITEFLAKLGLLCEPTKCKAMVVGNRVDHLSIGSVSLPTSSSIVFLGVTITDRGNFAPKHTSF
jgi:hypothetical protein